MEGSLGFDPAMANLTLSELWEGDTSIRARAKQHACLTIWANPKVIGVASTGAMALNVRSLEILAEWWASQNELPLAIPIDGLRAEAWVGKIFSPPGFYRYL